MTRAKRGELSITSYAVLGLVNQLGEPTPYDLISFGDLSVADFWDFRRSQVYAEVDRLVARRMLDEEREPEGRRRRLLRLTSSGRDALQQWVSASEEVPVQVRDEALLKLFFAAVATPETVVELARRQVDIARAQLKTYEAMAEIWAQGHPEADRTDPDAPIRLVLEAGIRIRQTMIDYWQEITDDPPTGNR